jgi:hypothetical protein
MAQFGTPDTRYGQYRTDGGADGADAGSEDANADTKSQSQ